MTMLFLIRRYTNNFWNQQYGRIIISFINFFLLVELYHFYPRKFVLAFKHNLLMKDYLNKFKSTIFYSFV